MKTVPVTDDRTGRAIAFEIENAYINPSMVATVLSAIVGVSEVRPRRPLSAWDGIHVRFRYRDADCVVWEAFGDNSRYWIGQHDSTNPIDMSDVERAFIEHRPRLDRRIVGDILSLRCITQFFKRDA